LTSRPLSREERSLLELLLRREFAGREQLLDQARTVCTMGSSCSCGCPSFSLVANRSLPAAPVEQRMVSDAHGVDPGGNLVGLLLFADDGYLSNLEIYGMEGRDFAGLPRPEALRLSEWSEPSPGGVRHLLNP
jgi:hypothetical protein